MHIGRILLILAFVVMFAATASSGTISAVGSVDALTDVTQLTGIVGLASWEYSGLVPLDHYTPLGLTFHTGPLTSVLSGVTTPGSAIQPRTGMPGTNFPLPIAGGGTQSGTINSIAGGVGTFSVPVTQVGVTISRNGSQFLTAWDTSGNMVGQVNWVPISNAAFFGLDTRGVPIGMIALGNDDLWGGATYSVGGSTIFSDDWLWAAGIAPIPEPGTLALLALGGSALVVSVRRRRRRSHG